MRTPEELALGYMHRESISDDEVMLFIFPKKNMRMLWMYNVNFDLDAAFLDDKMNILEIRELNAYPEEKNPKFFFDKVVRSSQPVKYALEAKAGFFEKNGLKVGDSVRKFIPGGILRELRVHP